MEIKILKSINFTKPIKLELGMGGERGDNLIKVARSQVFMRVAADD